MSHSARILGVRLITLTNFYETWRSINEIDIYGISPLFDKASRHVVHGNLLLFKVLNKASTATVKKVRSLSAKTDMKTVEI